MSTHWEGTLIPRNSAIQNPSERPGTLGDSSDSPAPPAQDGRAPTVSSPTNETDSVPRPERGL